MMYYNKTVENVLFVTCYCYSQTSLHLVVYTLNLIAIFVLNYFKTIRPIKVWRHKQITKK